MLIELQNAVEKAKRDGDRRDDDVIRAAFQRASRDLIARQTIHHDDTGGGASTYKLIKDHRRYFESILCDGMGFELTISEKFGYVSLSPGAIGTGTRRGRLRKDETIALFVLRLLWDEGMRGGNMDDYGRTETDSDELIDRFRLLARTDPPGKGDLWAMLRSFQNRGMVRLGEEDAEEKVVPIKIMPTIQDIVTTDLAEAVQNFAANPPSNSDTILEQIEVDRQAVANEVEEI